MHEAILPHVWSNGQGLLTFVLAHEIGHVFGLPHVGNGGNGDLMAENFPDQVVRLGNDLGIFGLRTGFF
jgi:hypothetical protein